MASSTTTRTRKGTKFYICASHWWLKLETRRTRAECFVEGGPGYGEACTPDDPCRLWPGTDFYTPDISDGSEFPLDWAVNR